MAETITLKPYPYSLDFECPVPWPSQESTINQEYPFQYVLLGSIRRAGFQSKSIPAVSTKNHLTIFL